MNASIGNEPATAPLDAPVFYSAVAALALIVGGTALAPSGASTLFDEIQGAIVANASWYYVLVVAIILVCSVVIAMTRYGEIKLGPDHAEPDYSLLSWFAMLFAAGMGIGLMFFGVAEPVMHFLDPPVGPGGTVEAAKEAMKITFFHWGLHAWSIYAIVALMLAYFGFRHGLPLTLRSAFYPLVGKRIYGTLGTAVDVFAILSTTFGVATSLGFGVEQINSGLNYVLGVPKTAIVQVILIALTTAAATASVVSGLDVGIRRLSEINIVLAVLLMAGILLLGPTVYLLQAFVQNCGAYLASLVGKTFTLYAYQPTDWLGGWTIFYWGWWISWAPFVGLFIARISRGRTLREFVLGALIAPTLFTLLWMTVFGNSAVALILNEGSRSLADAVRADQAAALFEFLGHFPMAPALSTLAIIMVFVFFITSADSGAMVLNMLSSRGRDDTPIARRVFWMATVGLTALVLLLAGGLSALQTAAIASALPFSVIILVAMWGFLRALSADHAKRQALLIGNALATPDGAHWRERLRGLLRYPDQEDVQTFIREVVRPALLEFAGEIRRHGREALVEDVDGGAQIVVSHPNAIDFRYAVLPRWHARPGGGASGALQGDGYYRAEVHLGEGGQDYDVMDWTTEQLLQDLLAQYERHLQFLHALR